MPQCLAGANPLFGFRVQQPAQQVQERTKPFVLRPHARIGINIGGLPPYHITTVFTEGPGRERHLPEDNTQCPHVAGIAIVRFFFLDEYLP